MNRKLISLAQQLNSDAFTALDGGTSLSNVPVQPSQTVLQQPSPELTTDSGSLTASHSVTITTATKAAQSLLAHGDRINAPFVALLDMEHLHASSLHDVRMVAPKLIPNAWEATLRNLGLFDQFGDIPSGLREGFRIGAAGPVKYTLVHSNHKLAQDCPQVIEDHIKTKLEYGRYSGPFTQSQLEQIISPFHSSPLGTVDKPLAPGKFCIVQDFSFLRSSPLLLLNAQINSDNFPCEWGFFHDVVQALHNTPPGTLAATCNVDAAFCQIPIHPDDRPHTVVGWNGQFYVDTFLLFGVASANGIFGRTGDAMLRIYSLCGFGTILKWVNDFLFIQAPLDAPNEDC
ncbi:putative LOC100000937 [Rhizoctonia solani AG-1 IB]|uniref:Putative LOC100000937 n=1 Tax=Thanatephorus cucumeris (strain AG1-IB / isolate 7/3/14) TaxID=1108050 RepID=M5C9R3_THACB|nr:putative LOC100000937 [Rhizoctonia solani AG-1 IB]